MTSRPLSRVPRGKRCHSCNKMQPLHVLVTLTTRKHHIFIHIFGTNFDSEFQQAGCPTLEAPVRPKGPIDCFYFSLLLVYFLIFLNTFHLYNWH